MPSLTGDDFNGMLVHFRAHESGRQASVSDAGLFDAGLCRCPVPGCGTVYTIIANSSTKSHQDPLQAHLQNSRRADHREYVKSQGGPAKCRDAVATRMCREATAGSAGASMAQQRASRKAAPARRLAGAQWHAARATPAAAPLQRLSVSGANAREADGSAGSAGAATMASGGVAACDATTSNTSFTATGGTVPPPWMDISELDAWQLTEVRNADIDIVRLTNVATAKANALVQPFIFGRQQYAAHVDAAEAVRGLKFAVMANATICGHPRGTKPPSWEEMMRRARRVAAGGFRAEWDALRDAATARAQQRARGSAIAHATSNVDELARKAAKAMKHIDEGKEGKAAGEFGAPPILDAGLASTQQMVLQMTAQGELPAPELYADVPGVAPFRPTRDTVRAVFASATLGSAHGTLKVPMETYRVAVRAGGFEAEYTIACAAFAGTLHARAAFETSYTRLCVLSKGVDKEGNQCGRPLGMPEDDRRLWGRCLCRQDRDKHRAFFTGMLPEDERAWEERRQRARADVEAAAVQGGVADAAAYVEAAEKGDAEACARMAVAATNSMALDEAAARLTVAATRPKVPRNLGIGTPDGAAITHLIVRAWSEIDTRKSVLSGDIKNMFNTTKRDSEAEDMAKYWPQYVPFFRLFSAIATPIHLGPKGGLVVVTDGDDGEYVVLGDTPAVCAIRWGEPVMPLVMPAAAAEAAGVARVQSLSDGGRSHVVLDSATVDALSPDQAYRCLCYCVGGSQGDTVSPFKCTLPYHCALHKVQKRHPTTDIVGYLDDTYAHDYPPPLARFYADKIITCKKEAGAVERPDKATLFSYDATDEALRHFEATVPGHPDHPEGRLRCFKAVGGWIGHTEACERALAGLLASHAARLDEVDCIADTKDYVRAAWAKYRIGRVSFAQKPMYVCSVMPPSATMAPVQEYSVRMRQSFRSWVVAEGTCEPLRVTCAELQAFMPTSVGGLGYEANEATADARYAARVIRRWHDVQQLAPAVAGEALSTSQMPMLVEARAAYERVRVLRGQMETRYAARSQQLCTHLCGEQQAPFAYFDLFGTRKLPFAPRGLPPASALPRSSELDDTTISLHQSATRILVGVVAHSLFWATLDAAARVDALQARAGGPNPLREQTRIIACAQAHAMEGYNATVRQGGRRLTTAIFVTATQFRLGLCVTALRPRQAAPHVADYLGDFELNRMDRHGPHNAVLDVWVRAYRAAAHAVTVVKGDKQEGTQVAARFDANTVVDILCELMGGRLVGVELKCLHTVKSTYGKGMRSSHCDNGHVYAFGNTQEAVLRRIRGARRRGELTDGFFDHATGLGHITGVDWGEAPHQQRCDEDVTAATAVRPDYRDAIERGHDLRAVVHETWGGFDAGAEAELDALARTAKALGDGTDYAASNTPGAFTLHWARHLGSTLLLSVGELLQRSVRVVNSPDAAARARAMAAAGVGSAGVLRGGQAGMVSDVMRSVPGRTHEATAAHAATAPAAAPAPADADASRLAADRLLASLAPAGMPEVRMTTGGVVSDTSDVPAAVPTAGEMRSDVGDIPAAMPAAAPAPATLREARAAAAASLVVSAATSESAGGRAISGVHVRQSPRLRQLSGACARVSVGSACEGADRGRAEPGSLRRT